MVLMSWLGLLVLGEAAEALGSSAASAVQKLQGQVHLVCLNSLHIHGLHNLQDSLLGWTEVSLLGDLPA